MRAVATLFAVLALAGAMPAVASNDCKTDVAGGIVCHEFDLVDPVPAPYADHYYLWLGVGECVPSPLASDCRGVPGPEGSGTPTPVGNVGFGQFGMVYQESNGCPGLQRFTTVCGGTRQGDNMMLI